MRIFALILLFTAAALARDDGRYSNVDPTIKSWIEGLRDNKGFGCCDTADGSRVDDVDWRCDGENCAVKLDGEWIEVPPHALLQGANRIGYPMVWRWYENGRPKVRCFLRGGEI